MNGAKYLHRAVSIVVRPPAWAGDAERHRSDRPVLHFGSTGALRAACKTGNLSA